MSKYRAIPDGYMTVGEVAKKVGTTVRTLQYYDKEGLLSPSAESEGGRRLYTDKDLVILHQILSLKSLGFSLNDIKQRLIPLETPTDETYEFYQNDTVETIIERMLTEMADVIEENGLKAKFEAQGLNLYQGITLASIVQKEANNAIDQAKVAQVYYNRLAQGMSLGSDVTTQYAVDLVDPDRQIYTNNADALQIHCCGRRA